MPTDLKSPRSLFLFCAGVSFCLAFGLNTTPAAAQVFGCSPPAANAIVCENSQTGNPQSEWDFPQGYDDSQTGDPTIEGFATEIGVNQGQTVHFKVNTTATSYQIIIYRIGYYAGNGARKVATIQPSVSLPQIQPACLTDASTGLIDCGNWAESASWAVPANATSGLYLAKLLRSDTGGMNHMVFVVRADGNGSQILFQTSDTTWQAYNDWGGNSLYVGNPANRAYRVSYNRPFVTRQRNSPDWFLNAEYPMIRWLEANGYDVSYTTGIDSDGNGSAMLGHKIFLSVGHDEYWSGNQRANVEAARNAGINLAFFSGNEIWWKTRWENSIDGTNTPYRTLVCYKETLAGTILDPADPPTWTGTWRDPTFSPPADGGRPENELSGTLSYVNFYRDDAITVPSTYSNLRFWRNTAIATLAPGKTYTTASGVLGFEWDEELDNGSRPAGLIDLSSTTLNVTPDFLLDYGANYGAGTATHNLALYRAPSAALVFGAGTVQWSWGLDSNHDYWNEPPPPIDLNLQQATINLLADMGAQPASLQPGMVQATASTDTSAPVSAISSPTAGSSVPPGNAVTITGTASDSGGGVVAAVEVSVDGGTTWHRATGQQNWSYVWTPSATGTATLKSRAVDDSVNLEIPSPGVTVSVVPLNLVSIAVTPANSSLPQTFNEQFTATGTFSNGSTQNLTSSVTWTSSNTTAATITGAGLADAVAAGATTVGAALGSIGGSTGLTVTAAALVSLTVIPTSPSIGAGETQQFTATGTFSDGNTLNLSGSVVWSSTNTVAATISGSGLATGINGGNTTIEATMGSITGTAALTVLALPGPVGHWTFDDGSGTTAADSSGNGYTATLVGGVSWVTGKIGGAISDSGASGQYVKVPTIDLSATKTVTVTMWVNRTYSTSGGHTLFEDSTNFNNTTTGFGLFPDDDSCDGIMSGLNGNAGYSVNCYRQPSNGVWHHLAAIYDKTQAANNQVALYIDGVLQNPTQIYLTAANTNTFGANPIFLFSRGGTGEYNAGEIDDLRLYNRGLSATEIQQLYAAGTPVSLAVTPSNPSAASGRTLQFTATGTYSDGSTQNLTSSVTWTSTNTTVATITGGGLASGLATGNTTIQAASGSIANSTSLNVTPAELVSIALTPANPSAASGLTVQFTATGTYTDGSTQNLTSSVTWTSTNTGVATITDTGLATAVTQGSTTIQARETVGSISGSTGLTVTSTLASIAVTPANPSLAKGSTQQFTATGTYSDGSTLNLTGSVAWTSSNTAFATITGGGLASGLAAGATTIQAASGSITGSTGLTVTPPSLVSIALTPANTSIGMGAMQQFTATGTYSDASTQNLTSLATWTSTNTSVATISGTGQATGVAKGSTTIQAQSGLIVGSTGLTITAVLASIAVTPANASFAKGGTQQFAATGTYSDASTQNLTSSVTWTSSNTTVATITGTGLASGLAAGAATIQAASGSITGSTGLTVTPPSLVSIAVTPANASIGTSAMQQFTATGSYSDASTQNLTGSVTWSSNNTAIATIGAGGLATGVAKGITTIQASNGSINGSTTLTVTTTLVSISVMPANPSVGKGATQQFTATGTYSDGSTQNLTASATWSSTNTAVATITSGGLASGVSAGSTTVQAVSGSINGFTTLTVNPPTLVSIAVTPANAAIMKGATEQYTATGTYSDGSTQNLATSATWVSTVTTVATIGSAGLASGAGAGTTTIQATSGSITGSTGLTVTGAALVSIALTLATPSIAKGLQQQFTATGTYGDGSTQNLTTSVTWSSSKTTVATVTTGGLATAVATGSATIKAVSGSISASTVLTVTAAALESIAMTPANPSIPVDATQQFTATGTYTDGSTKSLGSSATWTSSNTAVATVSNSGLATGKGVGTTTIQAASGSITGSTQLTVTTPVLASIAVKPANASLTVGGTQQYTATGTYTGGSTQNLTGSVTWTSTNTSVATISSAGLATAEGTGSATIQAALGSITGSTGLTVSTARVVSNATSNGACNSPCSSTTTYLTKAPAVSETVVVLASWAGQALTASVTDGVNTYTPIAGPVMGPGGILAGEVWYAVNTGAPTTFTVSLSGNSAGGLFDGILIQVITLSGLDTVNPLDLATVTTTTGTGTALSVTSGAASVQSEMIWGMFLTSGPGTPWKVGSGWTEVSGGEAVSESMYKNITSGGTQTPSVTAANASNWIAFAFGFKTAGF